MALVVWLALSPPLEGDVGAGGAGGGHCVTVSFVEGCRSFCIGVVAAVRVPVGWAVPASISARRSGCTCGGSGGGGASGVDRVAVACTDLPLLFPFLSSAGVGVYVWVAASA